MGRAHQAAPQQPCKGQQQQPTQSWLRLLNLPPQQLENQTPCSSAAAAAADPVAAADQVAAADPVAAAAAG